MPDLLILAPLLLAVGILAGGLAGLLGLGGGLVVVPALYWLLRWHGLDPDAAMPVAVATSLATMVLTTLVSAWTHWRQGTVHIPWLPWLLPGMALGALLGPLLAVRLSAGVLTALFAGFMFFVAWRMLLPGRAPEQLGTASRPELLGGGLAVSVLSALIGVGGGIFTVPWMQWRGLNMVTAVGVSVSGLVVIALTASLSYALLPGDIQLAGTIGRVHLPSVLLIAAASMLSARAAARLAPRLPDQFLRRAFAGVLILVGLVMLL